MRERRPMRHGRNVFVRKMFLAVFNGMFAAKAIRHLMKPKVVHRTLEGLLKLLFPVHPDKVVFMTFSGALECNPKYIAKELKRRGGHDIVWLIGAVAYRARSMRARALGYKAAPIWSLRGMYHIVTAGIWVDNAQMFILDGMPSKRKGQRYLNTWHGSLGIKRLESAGSKIKSRIKKAAAATDAVLVNSVFEENVFAESVFPDTKKLRLGHPRNDIFFMSDDDKAAIRDRVRTELGLEKDEKFVLYAPTFREIEFFTSAGGVNFGNWARALTDRFGGRWRVMLRLHPHDAQALAEGLISLPIGVCDLSSREDIQELLVAADAGITDYSSWIFDYLLGGNPGFIYAPDKKTYDESRGFYYPLEETPFPVAETEDELCARIRAFDENAYAARCMEFLRARGCMEDGKASGRAVDWIERRESV